MIVGFLSMEWSAEELCAMFGDSSKGTFLHCMNLGSAHVDVWLVNGPVVAHVFQIRDRYTGCRYSFTAC